MIGKEKLKEIVLSNQEFTFNQVKDIVKRENIYLPERLNKVVILYGVRRSGKTFVFWGGFFRKYGELGYKKEDYSYRVLITAPTEERRNNLVEQAIEQGSLEMCWFGLFSEVIQDPLGKVWIRGKEYKEVLESLNEWERERILRTHRKLERDEIIKEGIDRRSILE